MLVPAVAQVVAAFLCRCGRAVAMDVREVEELVPMQLIDRAREDPVDAAVSLPASHDPVDAGVVDFRQPLCIRFDRQHLPLTPHIERLQDVVEHPL
ncbi:hypothetical protein AWV80_17475 [Cupriavidus sp. UYMU48A]|nr:hypothetical protein AWV80_17475 [Cupriavidus sp. UYMU48A]